MIDQRSSREQGSRQAISECKNFLLNLFPNVIVSDSQVCVVTMVMCDHVMHYRSSLIGRNLLRHKLLIAYLIN